MPYIHIKPIHEDPIIDSFQLAGPSELIINFKEKYQHASRALLELLTLEQGPLTHYGALNDPQVHLVTRHPNLETKQGDKFKEIRTHHIGEPEISFLVDLLSTYQLIEKQDHAATMLFLQVQAKQLERELYKTIEEHSTRAFKENKLTHECIGKLKKISTTLTTFITTKNLTQEDQLKLENMIDGLNQFESFKKPAENIKTFLDAFKAKSNRSTAPTLFATSPPVEHDKASYASLTQTLNQTYLKLRAIYLSKSFYTAPRFLKENCTTGTPKENSAIFKIINEYKPLVKEASGILDKFKSLKKITQVEIDRLKRIQQILNHVDLFKHKAEELSDFLRDFHGTLQELVNQGPKQALEFKG